MSDDRSVRKYFVAHNGRKYGPLSLTELSSRRLSHDMLAWYEGMPEWLPIGQVPELAAYIRHAAPVRTTAPPAMPTGGSMTGHGQGQAAAAGAPGIEPFPGIQTGGRPRIPAPPLAPSGRVKFLGITSIVLASIGMLCCPVVLVGTLVGEPLDQAMQEVVDPGMMVIGRSVIHGVMFMVSIAMLVAGIGLLKGRRWAGLVGTISSMVCLVTYLGGLIFECGFVQWPLMDWAAADAVPDEVMGILVIGAISNAFAALVGMVWHVINIVLLNSRAVRASLR